MIRFNDDTARCSGRRPEPGAMPCPMRKRCERWLAFDETNQRDEPHQVFVMMPPESAFIRSNEAPVQTWSCPYLIETDDEVTA